MDVDVSWWRSGDLGGDTIAMLTAASDDALAGLAGLGAAVRPLLLRLVGGIELNEQRITVAIDLSEVHPAFEGESITASAAIGFVRTGQRIRLIVPH